MICYIHIIPDIQTTPILLNNIIIKLGDPFYGEYYSFFLPFLNNLKKTLLFFSPLPEG